MAFHVRKRTIVMNYYNAFFLCLLFLDIQYGWCLLPPEMSKSIHQKCQSLVGTTEEEIENSRRGQFNFDNEKSMCYLRCTLTEANVMDDEGKMTPLNAVKLLPPPVLLRMAPIVGACGLIDDSDPCQKAAKLYQCVHRKFPDMYEVP